MSRRPQKESAIRASKKLLSIEVTRRCNLDCLHCYVRGDINEQSSLSFIVVKNILSEGNAAGYRHLHLTGGEPFLWENLFEALEYAFNLGYQTVLINTNGLMLSTDICRKLAGYDGVLLSVSIDGSEQFHNRLRGEGTHNRTLRGIENALSADMTPIIFTTVYKGLLSELTNFAEDLFGKFPGIKHLSLIPIIPATHNGFPLSEELLEPKDFVRLVRTVSFLNVFGFKIEVLNEPLVNVVSNLIEMPWFRPSVPIEQEGNIIVMANRKMGLSHFNLTCFGEYAPGMIMDVLASDAYKKLVLPNESTCQSCKFQQICLENDMLRPSQPYGKGYREEPYCRRVLNGAL